MRATSDSHRRRLTTIGIAGAALALSAVAGVPALADSHDSHGSHGSHGSQKSHSDSAPKSEGSGGHGESETGTTSSPETSPANSSDSSTNADNHNPPGNNGTVFIHDVAGDQSPHNVPHVDCTFYVDFFGFDDGQTVTVSFAGQAPTGKGTALGGTWTGVVSDDDASGAGNDFDHELAYTADELGVTALGPPAHQGYHVKMTVATNEPGGKKSKVFWIEPCTSAPVVGGETGGAVLGSGAVKTTSKSGTTTVLGEKFTRTAPRTSVAGIASALPFTGAEIARMAAAGLAALGAGALFVATGRRRRHQPLHRA